MGQSLRGRTDDSTVFVSQRAFGFALISGRAMWFWPDHCISIHKCVQICKYTERKYSALFRKSNNSNNTARKIWLIIDLLGWCRLLKTEANLPIYRWRWHKPRSSNYFCISAVIIKEQLCNVNNCQVLVTKLHFLGDQTNTVPKIILPFSAKQKEFKDCRSTQK